ncbi:exonuclease domain-containing protein [Pseudahrensia aquimaris]|uniref:DNA-directed DNA polymerase n=1 Tax=Pseudahrensia aquimaris TaxID=744461 RepID=A0ABW3FD51_9HYPH
MIQPALFEEIEEAIVFDVETTGLDPVSDRIASICMIKANIRQVAKGETIQADVFHTLINPEMALPKPAFRIHGLGDDVLSACENFSEQAGEIAKFAGDLPLIAHNIEFDLGFLTQAFIRTDIAGPIFNLPFCTMDEMAEMVGGQYAETGRISLKKCCGIMGIDFDRSTKHDARSDAMATLQLAAAISKLRMQGY